MAVREVISYNKDYITGNINKEKKVKKDAGIKGKVLVQLFDANTNEKVIESYTENIIPDIVFKELFIRFFAGDVMGIDSSYISRLKELFSYIYLTDSTKPESASSEKISGNIIGYAERNSPYSGTDSKKGTINKTETTLEINNGKIRVNFVFDFPTHAANGTFESIYWGDDPDNLDYFYIGPPIVGRGQSGDGKIYARSDDDTRDIYWSVYYFMHGSAAKYTIYTDYNKGYVCFNGAYSSAINSTYFTFPEHLKGYQLIVPFNFNIRGFADWNNSIKLLNDSGEAITSSDISGAFPVLNEIGEIDYIIGWYFSTSDGGTLKVYKWSSVGVLQEFYEITNIATIFLDEYNSEYTVRNVSVEPIFWGGKIELYGYHRRTDDITGEYIYTNKVIRLNIDCTKDSEMSLKPKIGSSLWFASKGMDSSNIERRCYLSSLTARTKNRIYIYYYGTNGGSSFYQVVTPEGNLLKPYKENWGITGDYGVFNIIDTDKWIMYFRDYYSSSSYKAYTFAVYQTATSKPCGAHTKLANPVEKTDANTMKIQYMFEIDLVDYANDVF
ncbi:MAG: hypothetical protein PWQ37_1712 [Candidatus Petromonas sp.]|jgi:hypothetical protein|nr:hypothetical protein [Candidatus Petromonas sp.]